MNSDVFAPMNMIIFIIIC